MTEYRIMVSGNSGDGFLYEIVTVDKGSNMEYMPLPSGEYRIIHHGLFGYGATDNETSRAVPLRGSSKEELRKILNAAKKALSKPNLHYQQKIIEEKVTE